MDPRKAFRTGLKRTAHLWQEGKDDEVFNWFMASGVEIMMDIHCRLEDDSHLCAPAKAQMLRWQYAVRRDRFEVDLRKAQKTLLYDHWIEYDAWRSSMRASMVQQRDHAWDEYIIWRRHDARSAVLTDNRLVQSSRDR